MVLISNNQRCRFTTSSRQGHFHRYQLSWCQWKSSRFENDLLNVLQIGVPGEFLRTTFLHNRSGGYLISFTQSYNTSTFPVLRFNFSKWRQEAFRSAAETCLVTNTKIDDEFFSIFKPLYVFHHTVLYNLLILCLRILVPYENCVAFCIVLQSPCLSCLL